MSAASGAVSGQEVNVRLLEHGTLEYSSMVELRLRLLREPLGLIFTQQELADECGDLFFGAFLGERLVGCLILTRQSESVWKMRQVAVEADLRRHSIGTALVRAAEIEARLRGCHELILHARESSVEFYARLGYVIVGEPYIEVTLPHITMTKQPV